MSSSHQPYSLQEIMDDICPKKAGFHEIKCKDHIKIYAANEELLFFQQRDGSVLTTLHSQRASLPLSGRAQ